MADAANGNVVFVRGLPFDATVEELEALFEDSGPLKPGKSFFVARKGEQQHRGFGFVELCASRLPLSCSHLTHCPCAVRTAASRFGWTCVRAFFQVYGI